MTTNTAEIILARRNRELKQENEELRARIAELELINSEMYFLHQNFCEQVRDGNFVQLPPADLKLIEESQVK